MSSCGSTPLRLDFESQLHDLSGYLDANDSVGALAEMDRLRHTIVSRTDEGPVQIEREMADATLNGVRYQALLTALGRLTELNRLAISQEGR